MAKTFHYSIHGSPIDGWSLMVYKYYPYKFNPGLETITPYWLHKKHFETLDELLVEMKELEK